MVSLDQFLTELLHHGTIVFREHRIERLTPAPTAMAIMADAFDTHRLSVAGAAIPLDLEMAFEAAELVRQAAWAVVNRDERADQMARRVVLTRPPASASHHLSADLMLRYVPGILARARAIDFEDPLVPILVNILRRYPLSGILAGLDEGPIGPLNFGGHRGLGLLYAERLAHNDRPDWRPRSPGYVQDYYELITQRSNQWLEHGK